MVLATALLIIGLFLVVYGADRLVFAASVLCRSMRISPLIIGMTVVSIGTSLPEIMVATAAGLHGQLDVAVGIGLGSNIINILLILGLAALLHPFTVHSDILRRELPLMLLATVICGLLMADGTLSRLDGVILWAGAIAYLIFVIRIARHGNDSLTREQIAELPCEASRPVAFLWLSVALIIMPMATRMVIDNAMVLANYFGLSDMVIGMTVIAIGTSLPELATAIAGARKGEDDIAIGNIIGSNIFNIFIVLGIPALLSPGSLNPIAFGREYWVMLAASVALSVLCWRKSDQIGRIAGTLLICGFIAWISSVFLMVPDITG